MNTLSLTTNLAALLAITVQASALTMDELDGFGVVGVDVSKHASAVLGLMGYTVVPDLTTSFLSIESSATNNPDLRMLQTGGGFTLSKETPIYLEGTIGGSRYDPRFVLSDGESSRELPTKWTTVAATGGVGWDFYLTDELALRPIFNFSLGHVESDAALFGRWISNKLDKDVDFLVHGRMSAYGIGGSLMLDWEHVRPDYEIDVEARYTNIRLANFGDSRDWVKAESDAETAGIWARYRAPTGMEVMGKPLRYVLEAATSTFLGDQADMLGFNNMSSVGIGVEFDSSAYDMWVTRTRIVFRYAFGEHIDGTSIGLAVSF